MNNAKSPAMWKTLAQKEKAISQYQTELANSNNKIVAVYNSYKNVEPGISVRDGFDRNDYNSFRPNETIPTRDEDIINACMVAYERVPIVNNVINLMAEFVVRGLDICHPRIGVQNFGREWARRIDIKERSEAMIRMMLKAGVVVGKRKFGVVPEATTSLFKKYDKIKIKSQVDAPAGEIPMDYVIYDPRTVQLMNPNYIYTDNRHGAQYGVVRPNVNTQDMTQDMNTLDYRSNNNPFLGAITGRATKIPKNKQFYFTYKKDDSQLWAKPMAYPILKYLKTYDKLDLADTRTLDSAINNVNVWKLGSIELQTFPKAGQIDAFTNLLLAANGMGGSHIVWGPDVELIQSKNDAYNFLGIEKYIPTMTAIYEGLGVPPSLNGIGQSGGFSNNAVSLKVLVERLGYCRDVLVKFWENEMRIIQSVFGFREQFYLTFDYISFDDQSTTNKFLLDLADRNMVSDEFVVEQAGGIPEVEKIRVARENKDRTKGKMTPKASPYHIDSQQTQTLERTFAAAGTVAPSEVGVELKPKKPGEKSKVEIDADNSIKLAKSKPATAAGVPGAVPKKSSLNKTKKGGRPGGAKDSVKRKRKPTPRKVRASMANDILAIDEMQNKIDELLKPAFLSIKSKKTLRELTDKEHTEYEDMKFRLLASYGLGDVIDEDSIEAKLANSLPSLPDELSAMYNEAKNNYVELIGSQPTVEKDRSIKSSVYALFNSELIEDETNE